MTSASAPKNATILKKREEPDPSFETSTEMSTESTPNQSLETKKSKKYHNENQSAYEALLELNNENTEQGHISQSQSCH